MSMRALEVAKRSLPCVLSAGALVGSCLQLASCNYVGRRILEAKDTLRLQVVESGASDATTIRVSGLSGHSALSVERIETSLDGDVMIMLVHLHLTRDGESGSFEHTVAIPTRVNTLVFGLQKTTIWKRGASSIIAEISRSHVEANVPPASDFDTDLARDLQAWFRQRQRGPVTVHFELLRRGATQTGVSFPKYYAWVEVQPESGPVMRGAVRVAAMKRDRFEVLQFLSADEIRAKPDAVQSVFPAALVPDITWRASQP